MSAMVRRVLLSQSNLCADQRRLSCTVQGFPSDVIQNESSMYKIQTHDFLLPKLDVFFKHKHVHAGARKLQPLSEVGAPLGPWS